MKSLGLDLGGTNIKLALLESGRVVEQREAPTLSHEGDPGDVLGRIVELGRSVGLVDSVAVALPGLFDRDGVVVLLPNLYGTWTGTPLVPPQASESLQQHVRRGQVGNQQVCIDIHALLDDLS